MDEFKVVINHPAIEYLTRDPRSGVTGSLLTISGEVTERGARRRVPVRTGALYDSVALEIGQDEHGPYAKVKAAWYDVFLEKPARQMKRARRSLRTALRDIPRLM